MSSVKLSIVICSKSVDISDALKENISATVGLEASESELIVIDNSANDHSIFQAYNEGVKRASGTVLCFVHEDVVFRCDGWGRIVLKRFEQPEVGLVGVAGTHFLPDVLSTWFDPEMRSDNFIQGGFVSGKYVSEPVCHDKYRNVSDELVCVDGMFMCIRASLFDTVNWDDVTFSGFHCYDMDMCLQVLKAGYKVCMDWDILLEHCSRGNFSSDFYSSLSILRSKWNGFFPIVRGVTMTEGEIEARTRLVELKAERRALKRSGEYLLGLRLFRPLNAVRKKLSR